MRMSEHLLHNIKHGLYCVSILNHINCYFKKKNAKLTFNELNYFITILYYQKKYEDKTIYFILCIFYYYLI